MAEDIGGVVAVGEVADLIDAEDVRSHVLRERLAHASLAAGGREGVDELGSRGEERIEAVLQGAVSDRDGEVGLAATGLAFEDDGAALGVAEARSREPRRRPRLDRLSELLSLPHGMKTPITDPVTTAHFVLSQPGREARRVTVLIGRPYVVGEHEARCPVELRGFEPQYPDICGTDTLQALCLALTLVRRRLEDALDKGCTLSAAEGGEPYQREDVAALFSGVGAAEGDAG